MSFFQLLSEIKLRAWISGLSIIFITAVVTVYVEKVLPWFERIITFSLIVRIWWLLIAAVAIIVPPIFAALSYQSAHQRANSLNALDDSLLRLIPQLVSSRTRVEADAAMGALLEEFLRDVIEIFAGAYRGSIMRSAPQHPDYLYIWKSIGMPAESVIQIRFYIGDDETDKLRGCAGETYRDHESRFVHFLEKSGKGESDNPCYKRFPKPTRSPTRSFAVIPIIGSNNNSLGVLCIDSVNQTAFDLSIIQDLLFELGSRIAVAVEIYSAHSTKLDDIES